MSAPDVKREMVGMVADLKTVKSELLVIEGRLQAAHFFLGHQAVVDAVQIIADQIDHLESYLADE